MRDPKNLIEAAIGRLKVNTFEIRKGSQKIFSVKRAIFPETGPREHHKTVCFRELAVFSPCDETLRNDRSQLGRHEMSGDLALLADLVRYAQTS